MKDDFFRFPHTPHLLWLGKEMPRADKVLFAEEAAFVLAGEVTVEEKVDGANVGVSMGPDGSLRVQNRGSYLGRGAHPQFGPLWSWLDARRDALLHALQSDLMLFGEWCYAVHSCRYDRLPDWFLAFDVYDRRVKKFWSAARRDTLLHQLEICPVPFVAQGRYTAEQVQRLLGPSRVGSGPMEGLYVRRDEGDWLAARAKVVRPEFVQAIDQHWKSKSLEKNELVRGATRGGRPHSCHPSGIHLR